MTEIKTQVWDTFREAHDVIRDSLDRMSDELLDCDDLDEEVEKMRRALQAMRVAIHSYLRPDLE